MSTGAAISDEIVADECMGADSWWGDVERRRSDRIPVEVRSGLEGAGAVTLVELSLGGATIETTSRPAMGHEHRLHLGHRGGVTEVVVVPYRSWIYELYYDPRSGSQVRYRVRVIFRNPSIEALNLFYRIMLEHWNESRPGDPCAGTWSRGRWTKGPPTR